MKTLPSVAVHLTVAATAAPALGISDLPQFFLGSIAPDAVNTDGFAPREIRYAAHLRSRSYDEWKRNILYYREQREREFTQELHEQDLFAGVLLHLYTDIAWDEKVQPLLFAEFRRRGIPDEEFTDRKWQELDAFDSLLSSRSSYTEAAEQLKLARPVPVTTVTAEQLSLWRDEVVSAEYPPVQKGSTFLNDEHIAMTLLRTMTLMRTGK